MADRRVVAAANPAAGTRLPLAHVRPAAHTGAAVRSADSRMADQAVAAAAFDCCACGACCFDHDVLLSDGEADQFAADPKLRDLIYLYTSSGGLQAHFLRRDPQTQACTALAGKLGECACTIYAERPMLCRAFEPGSADCLASRERFGMAVGRAVPAGGGHADGAVGRAVSAGDAGTALGDRRADSAQRDRRAEPALRDRRAERRAEPALRGKDE